MPLTYSVDAKNARMTATRDACADGTLEILTSADAVLASIGLSTAGGTVAGGVWTLAFDGPATASGTGTATKARIKNSSGAVVGSGLTVSATGGSGDVRLDNTSIASGQSVSVSSFTITHA